MVCHTRIRRRSVGGPQNMSVLNTVATDSLAVLSSDEHVMLF